MAGRVGLTDIADAGGKTALDLPNREEAMALHRDDEAFLRDGTPQHERLELRRGADGVERSILASRLPLADRDGRLVGVIGILRDVTEQKRAEERIHEAVRRRDQFLAMLSHELRNPLSAVVTATALLKSEEGARDLALRILERQSEQMSRLLDDLLEASRVTQNKIELRKSRLDLRTVVNDAADAVRSLMESRGLSFDVDIVSSPLPILGDAARLQQIQVNLLSNAAKYTPAGGHVKLEARTRDGRAEIRVNDDGAGIPRHMLSDVFELFVQSRRTLDRSQGGLGVGLTLVRSLVEMHGGTVAVESDGEGKGSEFIVELPLSVGPLTERAPRPPRCLGVRKGSKVVVVEDNEDSRQLLCELLTRAGLVCASATSGPEGLALIDELTPAAAILDLGLPGMDGFEVARRVRENPAHECMCLLALTGYGQPSDRAAALDVGFDEHLVKPILPNDLLRLLVADA
jgi:two-component system CheB/CheR fusion protein